MINTHYWKQMKSLNPHTCPSVQFFRFLGYSGIELSNKNILEIGFGGNNGMDLLEFQKRGATVYGTEINQYYIDEFHKNNPKIPILFMNAGTDELPFRINFDLIYHLDVIYYLSDEEIDFHFNSVYQNLMNGGHFAFQFIECDLFFENSIHQNESLKFDFDLMKSAKSNVFFRGETNPFRKLDIDNLCKIAYNIGFKLLGTKTLLESYTPDETVYRLNRYLLFTKQ